MKGYHYLMRLAHLVNALALATKRVASQVRTQGVQAFLHLVHESCAHRWLRHEPRWSKQVSAGALCAAEVVPLKKSGFSALATS
jgi:hypothetical protein